MSEHKSLHISSTCSACIWRRIRSPCSQRSGYSGDGWRCCGRARGRKFCAATSSSAQVICRRWCLPNPHRQHREQRPALSRHSSALYLLGIVVDRRRSQPCVLPCLGLARSPACLRLTAMAPGRSGPTQCGPAAVGRRRRGISAGLQADAVAERGAAPGAARLPLRRAAGRSRRPRNPPECVSGARQKQSSRPTLVSRIHILTPEDGTLSPNVTLAVMATHRPQMIQLLTST